MPGPAEPDFTLRLARRGPVARLTFQRGARNHVSVGLLAAIGDALDELRADETCHGVVLTAKGSVFCAGADLTSDGRESAGRDWLERLYAEGERLVRFDKPLVAAISGATVGAGLGLALVCDARVVTPAARFWGNFVKLGTHPGFSISRNLPALIGQQRAALMLLAGRRIDGARAVEWGLADELVAPDRLIPAAMAYAARLAWRPGQRGAETAAFVAHSAHERAQQNRLRRTLDYAEGVRAVAERRPGRFVAG